MNLSRSSAGGAVPALYIATLCTLLAWSCLSFAESDTERSQQSIQIIEPEEGQLIKRPGEFTVIAEAEPNLQGGQRMQLFIDGGAHGMPNSEGRFSVSGVASGQHKLQINITDQGGAVLESSLVRTITVE